MNKKGFAPIVVLLIILGVLVVGGAVWHFSSRPVNITQQPPATSTISHINTSSWKTYLDFKDLISFSIPVSSTIIRAHNRPYGAVDALFDNTDREFIYIYNKPESQKLIDWYIENFKDKDSPKPPSIRVIVSQPKETKLNGYKALEDSYEISESPLWFQKSIFITDGNKVIEFQFSRATLDSQPSSLESKILGSFKFVSQSEWESEWSDVSTWATFNYPSEESVILPNISFKYPAVLGTNIKIYSRKTNRPQIISDDWGGFVDFQSQTMEYQVFKNLLRIEFFKRTNLENSFEEYIRKQAGTEWDSISYFQINNLKAARMKFSSPSHYDADVAQYFIDLGNKEILAISTSGDKTSVYDVDENGYSTRDKILSTLKFISPATTSQ